MPLVWFQKLDKSGQLVDWEQFVRTLLIRFDPNCYDDPIEALTRLRQVGKVKEYKTNFEFLSNRLRVLSK